MVSTNTPLIKLNNIRLKTFLDKHTWKTASGEFAIWKNHLGGCHNDTTNEMCSQVEGIKLGLSIDKIIDNEGRYVAKYNVAIRF